MPTMTDTHAKAHIEYVRIHDLPDHPDNPRIHNLAELRTSIRRFGFTTPAVLDERTGLLVEGHGRKKALIAMQDEQGVAPDGVAVGDEGAWSIPVVRGWSSATDAEARAYLLAGNQHGEWDPELLVTILGELASADVFAGTGFTADDLDNYLAELGKGELPDQGTDADLADLTDRSDPDTPRTVQGMHEVGLAFRDEDHRRYLACVAQLRDRWGIDASPVIVLRALSEALGQ
jgi:hypothetical protein